MTNLRKLFELIRSLFLICLTGLNVDYEWGLLPQGEVMATTFTVSGIRLSPQMVYTGSIPSRALVPSISSSGQVVTAFLTNLAMNAVDDVLQQQGRSAFLSDPVIMLILQHMNVTINYNPLECKTASTDPTNAAPADFGGTGITSVNGCCLDIFLVHTLVTISSSTKQPPTSTVV